MDSEPEFPVLSRMEIVRKYFNTESLLKRSEIHHRKNAVSIIANDMEGGNATEKIRLITIACLIMSAKMKMHNFSFDQLSANLLVRVNLLGKPTKDMNVRITLPMIMRVQLRILDVLNWELPPVTAFCFLKHYYPYFKQFSGFKRRCINEIIVQAQGGHTFLQYKPYQIAFSAFLAATKIAYPPKYYRIANPSNFHKIDDQELNAPLAIVIAVPQEETNDVGASKGRTDTTQVQVEELSHDEVISKIQKFYKEEIYRKQRDIEQAKALIAEPYDYEKDVPQDVPQS
ncbi:cyclin-D1-1 [Trifolium pratense]|uniref:Cyclin-D1-1 n=1 Tax=Trifolium pratense TaxID=57577 RepID=A0A2K3PF52_TRIPR|nr:cyclin-D1-1 [Trifolium pratense]